MGLKREFKGKGVTNKKRFDLWHADQSWEEAEKEWDRGARDASALIPLKKLKSLPKILGIAPCAKRFLKLKSLWYMLRFDHRLQMMRKALKRPFKHLKNYLVSIVKRKSHVRDGDFFLYGFDRIEDFSAALSNPETVLVVGFSYCHKPLECPSGRFTDRCIKDPQNAICRQCFIGKALNALPLEQSISILIKTIHHIGEKIFDVLADIPSERALFLISACEMTLEMFGDWGNMVGIRGVGVRLDGRICNTMRAFELSERGIKPGLTVVLPKTQTRILQLIRKRREAFAD